jgi:hypothetical protein
MYLGGKRHAHACLIVLMPSLDSSFAWRAWWRAARAQGSWQGSRTPMPAGHAARTSSRAGKRP